ncbi:MAG: LEPR-XLL domain-containing protein, partial [Sedimenticolaceae bacterium]
MAKNKGLKQKQKRKPVVIESLEPRIMMSADLPGLDTLDIAPDDPLDVDLDLILAQAEEAFLSASNDVDAGGAESAREVEAVVPAEEPNVLLPSSELSSEDARRELIIVDPSTPDYELLLADVSAVGDDGTR